MLVHGEIAIVASFRCFSHRNLEVKVIKQYLSLAVLLAAPLSLSAAEIVTAPSVETLALNEASNRLAVPVAVDFDIHQHGEWSADGMDWSLTLMSLGAKALYVEFDQLELPAGAELTQVFGEGYQRSWTAEELQGVSWLPRATGDTVTIEVSFAEPQPDVELRISEVNYGYKSSGDMRKAGSCNVHTVCEEGDGWRDEIQSVAKYDFRAANGGRYQCSGVLVNNTSADSDPLFLTAEHCVGTEAEAASMTIYWNYEARSCGSPDWDFNPANVGTQFGATLLAAWSGSDFSLVRLRDKPNDKDSDNDVHYAGWDRRDIAHNSAAGIHHPSGDPKRISLEDDPLHIATYGGYGSSSGGGFLRVNDWDVGTTEGGSSGSGLWNASRRLIGQLSGGNAECGNNSADWYGRIGKSWTGGGTPETRLSDWLDPASTGAECLDGADPSMISLLQISGSCGDISGGSRNPEGAEVGITDDAKSENTGGSGGGGAPFGIFVVLLALLGLRGKLKP